MNNTTSGIAALNNIGLSHVQLTGAYHVNAFEKEMAYLLSYDPDRLLVGFREVAGLPAKATIYPGWEDTEIRGHTLGHFLTACAQAYMQNRNADLLAKLEYIIDELSLSQLDNGYLSAFPETLFDNVEKRKPAWVPWYTMHKIIAGLIIVVEGTGNQTAYDIVAKLGDWVADRTSKWSKELRKTVLAVEYGGMNDCLYDLFKLTKSSRHLEAAHQFDEINLFEAIRSGQDILKGKHANTTIPKFLGALNRYLTLGESEIFYREAAEKFWDMVVYHHSYITGGNSESEHFGDSDLLDGKRSDITCETCNSYNMLKLTRELFKLTQDIKYADFYENTYMNAILSSQHPDTGMTMYFQPMATGYFKVYSSPFEHFWCCTGTGMESFTKLNDSIYFQLDQQLYVNQYVSSQLDWSEQNIKITQNTDFPYTDKAQLMIETVDHSDKHFTMCLRIPEWASGEISFTINGEHIQPKVRDGYAHIERVWMNGDSLQLRIPMVASYYPLADAPNVVGFKYGPVVLSAALGTEDMIESKTGVIVSVPTKRMLVKDFVTPVGMNVQEWFNDFDQHFVRLNDDLAFVLRNTDEEKRLVFTPHFKQHNERYGIYWNFVEADSDALRDHQKKSHQQLLLKENTIDSVQVGNDQYELEHYIQGEHTYAGSFEGLNGRRAEANGWFSYEMKVLPGQRNGLLVTFSYLDADRSFGIWVNGHLLATETVLHHERKREFYDKVIEIPVSLIAEDQESIVVRFAPVMGGFNGVYGVLRTIKP
ncbi:glycoside hydrolase family 127 protein [Paenibacillus crassostreae]|uniref:Glycosyl hydrolase n=1 Tax=Paenibacillus crassostreae TaxID=1763538 RepID=A0A167GBM0_9BACL|nr:beta-L-arabinofuranosidase domain-containing protein [Paenibacillus crassostreae]AOZ92650.1 hypothetical protein LPB68_10745 [Paenibacillus crassostreae]OAB77419.1 hypothetical protein PNBC_01740 [Paenibacillus crassostreae]